MSEFEITSDSQKVWVNGPTQTLARFVRKVSYHYDLGSGIYVGPAFWDEFVGKMGRIFKIPPEDLEKHKPVMVCLDELLVLMADVERSTGRDLHEKLKAIIYAPDKAGIEHLKREVIRRGYGKGSA